MALKPTKQSLALVLSGALLTGSVLPPAFGQGTKPAMTSTKISPLETQVLGGGRWLKGSAAALRVLVKDHDTGRPVDAVVGIALTKLDNNKPVGKPISLYSGSTNSLGTLAAKFKVGVSEPGPYKLTVNVLSPLGKDLIEQNVSVEESATLMLTSDKPVYQPGQTMHLRVLGLDTATRAALASTPVTFEIEDARGNKVYKQKSVLTPFGIGATDFVLADEVNRGTFTLRAVTPVAQVEKKVRVERYVLPKFKVGVKTEKAYYLPGETVKGTISARYFFGKPVAGGQITLNINTVDIGVSQLKEITGKTDAEGNYRFTYRLPQSLIGQAFEGGKATVGFEVTLKDTAEHTQEGHTAVPVVKSPVQLTIVSENRSLVPGVANRFYVAAASPDGQPLKNLPLGVTPQSDGRKYEGFQVKTDGFGIAVAEVLAPPKGTNLTLQISARDGDGRTATAAQTIAASYLDEGIILRPDRPIARVGEKITFAAISTVKGGTLYLDILKNHQTILTQAVGVQNGTAKLTVPATPDMVGTLEVHAYKILPNEEIIRDVRTVIVSPADDLKISVMADKGEYKPGGEAVLRFAVTDAKKNPVLAALSLAVVDESVFALSELQPGLERIYFLLEKELMEPKYEIHGLRPAGLIEGEYTGVKPGSERDGERQRAASMLLAKAEPKREAEFYHNTYTLRYATLLEKLREPMIGHHRKIQDAVNRFAAANKTPLTQKEGLAHLVKTGFLKPADLLDPWRRPYRVQLFGQTAFNAYFALWTSGPDGKFSTSDDLYVNSYQLTLVSGYGTRIDSLQDGGRQRGRGFAGGEGGFGDRVFLERRGDLAGPMGPAGAPLMAFKAGRIENAPETEAAFDLSAASSGGGAEPVRVREYFPETLFWNPSIITDEKGGAILHLPIADSITTWRVSASANSQAGQLGSAESGLKVFQDFFADIDLPVSLTQNDRLELPIAVYNYLPEGQTVTLTLQNEPWFALEGDPVKTVKLNAGQVSVVHFPITVKAIGSHALTITARGTKLSDAVKRTIEVLPDGKEYRPTINDRLEGSTDSNPTGERTLHLSPDAIQEASTIFVKLYPGAFSQVVEGLDNILRMPNGCFEQTSSTTYPNVLVLDYLKAIKKINPELQMKAEGYINIGYQRLVTFEVKDGGGFSWFGDNPAHQILTAYGLLEFTDMAKVHEVDPNLILRTQNWLAGKMRPGGFWEEKNPGIAEGIINRQTGALRTTAYILWALAESGYKGEQVAAGVNYVKAHYGEAKDPYTLAVLLNLFAALEPAAEFTAQVANDLIGLAKDNGKTAAWESDTKTFTGAEQAGADLETTGLAAYGLVKWGRNTGFLNKVLTHLVASKDSFGTWQSTQGTVWAMKALLTASKGGAGSGRGTVTVMANGQRAASFEITPDNNDVMRQIDLKEWVQPGDNKISLHYAGEGSLQYQLVGRYYLPWSQVPAGTPDLQPLALKVDYDKTRLAQDDTAEVTVTVKNRTNKIAEMPLIDVGVPPGFEVIPDALAAAVENKRLSKFTVAARQVILYLKELAPGQELRFSWTVRAKFPIRAQSPLSKAYPYYNPEKVTTVSPTAVEVSGK